MADTPKNAEFTHPIVVAKLSETSDRPFDLTPTEDQAKAIAKQLDAISVKKLRFIGTIGPEGKDWVLEGKLGATVTQACVVTLEPVRTRVDIVVRRRYTNDIPEEQLVEAIIPADDDVESLGPIIDPASVAIEALALELPEYPRVEGAALEDALFSPPGTAPLTDEAARPFAGLEALKKKLEDNE